MNIFISNLSFRINDADLKQIFEEYGDVSSAKVITDKYTGKSRGFGFVEISDEESANKAITELDKAEYDGKVINVSIAKPRTENKPFNNGGGYNKSRGGGFGGSSNSNYQKRDDRY